jgi:orotate phosphoribosyltransferase
MGQEFSCAILRKEAKMYPCGPTRKMSSWIGPKDSGYEYNLLDDVVASGLTKRSAAQKMLQEGIRLRRIIVLFDREQGDGLRQEGFDLHAIFKASDVLNFYLERCLITLSDYHRIKRYLASRRFDTTTVSE